MILRWTLTGADVNGDRCAWPGPAPDNDPRVHAPHLKAWLRGRRGPRRAALMIPVDEVILRRVPGGALAGEALRRRVDDELPWPIEQSVWLAHPLGETTLIAGVSKRRLGLYRDALASAGLRLNGVALPPVEGAGLLWLESPRPSPGHQLVAALRPVERRLAAAAAGLLLAAAFLHQTNLDLRARGRQLTERRDAAGAGRAAAGRAVADLSSAVGRLPAGTRLTAYSFDGHERTLTLQGRSGGYAQVSALVNALGAMPGARQARSEKASLSDAPPAVDFIVRADLR